MVKPGYKQTEIGEIPKDWDVKQIGQLCTLINGRGFKPHEWKTNGLPIIRIQNLNGSEEFNYFQGNYQKKIEVKNGQLLFAWSGSRGTSFGPHVWMGELGLLNYHTWKVVVDENLITSSFFLYALKKLTKFIEDKAHGASALVHTQKWEMEGFRLSYPSDPFEQKAIAKALSDVDELIVSMEKLIAKKQDIKTATMQQLLTGKKRLPGFGDGKGYIQTELGKIPEDWDVISLKKHVSITSGESPSKFKLVPYGVPYFKVEQLNNDPKYAISTPYHINFDKTVEAGSIIFPKRGASILLNKIRILFENSFMDTNLMSLTVKENLWNEYLFYCLVYQGLDTIADTTSIPQINNKHINPYKIIRPDMEEQKAIAGVLSDVDTELELLQVRLNKIKTIKQGMMQELLTGRTRLI